MLDMGFSEDIIKIAKKLPKTCQTIMFSATMPDKIEDLAKSLLKNPVEIKLAVSKPAEKIKQSAYVCYETQKMAVIKDIFKSGDLKRVIIFCGSKFKVKQVAGALQRKHINCGEMHSDLDQAQRDEVMFKFKSDQIDVLVATDIVARGIDIDDIAMVINYDVPHDAEDYVHRIGRTARAERDGVAITLVSEEDMFYFQQIEKFIEKTVDKTPLPEELKGPEYIHQGKPKKNVSAKNRRRNDRNETAHRDKKQGRKPQRDNTQRDERNNNRDNGGEGRQYADRKQNYQKKRNNNYNHDNNSENKQNQRTDQKNPNATAQNSQTAQNPKNNKQQQQRRRGNVEGNYKKRTGQKPQHSNIGAKPQHSTAAQQPVKKEGGLKKFIKKLFRI
jgi:superfamily II DNA/RNA helicase